MRSINELHEQLETHIPELKNNKAVLESVKSGMLKNGVLRGETQRIFMGERPVRELELRTIILFTEELYKASGVYNLNPYGYFTDKEIEAARNEKVVIGIKKPTFPIVIHNAVKKDDKTFVAFVNAKKLVSLYNSSLLQYNYSINSKYKFVKNKSGSLSKIIDINMKEVKEIAEKIENNKYSIDNIILNVLRGSGSSELEVEFKDGALTIYESEVDIVKGLHDISALAYVVESNPEIELKVEVEIKHCDLQEIQIFFNQLNLKGGVN